MQPDANQPGSKNIEFIYQPEGKPKAVGLGVAQIDDSGAVVRIVSVHPENVPGGEEALVQIMTKAGWAVALR